jgi:nitroreductase
VIGRRRSVRAFCSTPIATEMLERILEAANAAPPAGNLQAHEIYVITNHRSRSAVARAAYDQFFVVGAPIALAFLL